MAINLEGIVTWLKGWFYEKSEVNTLLNAKVNEQQGQANKNVVTSSTGVITLEDKPTIPDVSGFIDTAGTGLSKSGTTLNHTNSVTAQSSTVFKKFSFDGQGHITGTADVGASDLPSHTHNAGQISDSYASSYTHINPTNSYQSSINSAINTAIGNLQTINAIEVVSTLPTASSSTLGKLYIISENSKINVYYTEQSGSSYSWHKMDADILDELSIDWSEIENNPFSSASPSDYASSNHNHGIITSDGKCSGTTIDSAVSSFLGVNPSTNAIGRYSKLNADRITSSYAYSNIGTQAGVTQQQINSAINTVIGNKANASDVITSISLVPKSTDANGKIIFYTGDEPSNS